MSRALMIAGVVALVAALSTSGLDREGPDPEWYVQACAEFSVC